MNNKEKNIINNTNIATKCKNCGHARDWHHIYDILGSALFGTRLGECTHCDNDQTQPFWKFWKQNINCCICKEFIPVKKFA